MLVKLSLLIGKEMFYAALWGSVLASPSVRLPASLFVVNHINRELSGKQQKYMLGTDYKLTVSSLHPYWDSLCYHNTKKSLSFLVQLNCKRLLKVRKITSGDKVMDDLTYSYNSGTCLYILTKNCKNDNSTCRIFSQL